MMDSLLLTKFDFMPLSAVMNRRCQHVVHNIENVSDTGLQIRQLSAHSV